MRINIKKTKVGLLEISKGKEIIVRINIGGEEIEQVKEFCYLVSMIMADAKCHREIKKRIAIGKEAFSKHDYYFRKKIKSNIKTSDAVSKHNYYVRKKIKRNTKTSDVGLDNGGRYREADTRSPTTRGVATSDILTCIHVEGREPEAV